MAHGQGGGSGRGFCGGHAQQHAKARKKSRLGQRMVGKVFLVIMCSQEDTMVEKFISPSRNVVDLSRYRERAASSRAPAISARVCRHCGAALMDGEREEECSSAFNSDAM